MGLRIGTNVASLSAQRQLAKSEKRLSHSLGALASGSRIVTPGDDAAGFSIAETLRAQVSSLVAAKGNAESARGLIQVAEGGLAEQNNILVRVRELAIQSASDSVSNDERDYLQTEVQQLTQEFDRIAKTTTYGSKKLLEGTGESFEFQLGTQGTSDDVIKYSLDADTRGKTLNVTGLSVSSKSDARSALETVDSALNETAKARAGFGAIQSRLEIASNNIDTQKENVMAARSRIADADIAYESSEMASARVQKEAGIAVLVQANQAPNSALRLLG